MPDLLDAVLRDAGMDLDRSTVETLFDSHILPHAERIAGAGDAQAEITAILRQSGVIPSE